MFYLIKVHGMAFVAFCPITLAQNTCTERADSEGSILETNE